MRDHVLALRAAACGGALGGRSGRHRSGLFGGLGGRPIGLRGINGGLDGGLYGGLLRWHCGISGASLYQARLTSPSP